MVLIIAMTGVSLQKKGRKMPELEVTLGGTIDFEVFCACGNGLCSSTEVRQQNGRNKLIVEPCEKCLLQEYDDGYHKGYDEGLSDQDETI
jgi:hypothetical protein